MSPLPQTNPRGLLAYSATMEESPAVINCPSWATEEAQSREKFQAVIPSHYPYISKFPKHSPSLSITDSSQSEATDRLKDFGKVIKEIRCGDNIYPFQSPLSQRDLIDLGEGFLSMRPLSANIVKRAIHENFQRIYRTPPHEITENDRELWDFLLNFIDYEGYVRKNPLPENLVGKLIKKDLFEVVISWFGGDEEIFDFRNFPSDIITATPGSTIHAKLKRYPDGNIKWIDCSISPELCSDEEAWREYGDEIKSLDEVPVGTWPKQGDE